MSESFEEHPLDGGALRGAAALLQRPIELARVQEALRTRDLVFVSHRAQDCLPVRRISRLRQLLTCEGGADAQALASPGFLVSLEARVGERHPWRSSSLDAVVDLQRGLPPVAGVALLPYASSRGLEYLNGRWNGAVLAGAPSQLKELIDDKMWTRRTLSDVGVPVPSSAEVAMHDLRFGELADEFGLPFFVQARRGSQGHGTFEVSDAKDLTAVQRKEEDETWLVSRNAGRTVLNGHGLIQEHVAVSALSVQVTGIPALGVGPVGYCGNDFAAARSLPKEVTGQARRMIHQVGEWLMTVGWRGIYGVDLVAHRGKVAVIEINPRLQASSWLLSELEYELGVVPTVVRHFGLWLDMNLSGESLPARVPSGSQLVVHLPSAELMLISHKLRPGVYRLDLGDRLRFVRNGAGLLECGPRDFLLFGLPAAGFLLHPGAVLARIASRMRLAQPNGRSLTGLGERIVRAVQRSFTRERVDVPSAPS